MSKYILSICVIGLSQVAAAQTMVNLQAQGKNPDFSAKSVTKPIQVVQTLPSTCTEGQFAFRSETTTVGRLFVCSANGVWVQQSPTSPQAAQSGSILTSNGFSAEWTTLGGDISGIPGSLSVNKILNRSLSTTEPQSGQALIWNGSAWVPQFPNVSSASIVIKSGSTTVSSTGVANFIAGSGIITSLTPVGGEAQIQSSADTSFLETRARAQSGEAQFCNSPIGNGSSYTCSLTPTLGSYTTGLFLRWVPLTDGLGGITTLRVGNLLSVNVTLADGSTNPGAGDIAAGQVYLLWFDGSGFRILNRSGTSAQAAFCPSTSASATAYVCAPSMTLNAYAAGLTLFWRPDVDGAGGATTLKVGALGAVPVKLADGNTNPEAGDLLAGREYRVWFDGAVFRTEADSSILTPRAATRPACSAGLRGRLWFGQSATGVKDTVAICAKDAADAYGWRAIY